MLFTKCNTPFCNQLGLTPFSRSSPTNLSMTVLVTSLSIVKNSEKVRNRTENKWSVINPHRFIFLHRLRQREPRLLEKGLSKYLMKWNMSSRPPLSAWSFTLSNNRFRRFRTPLYPSHVDVIIIIIIMFTFCCTLQLFLKDKGIKTTDGCSKVETIH